MNANNRDTSNQNLQQVLEVGNSTGNNKLIFPISQAVSSYNTIQVGNTAGVPTSVPTSEGWILYDSTNNNAYVFGNGVWSKIYSTGSVPTLQEVTTSGATTNVTTTFTNVRVSGNIQNAGGNVTVQDNLDVTGTIDCQSGITNTTGAGVIDVKVPLRNVSGGDLTISDNCTITGDLNVQGNISNVSGTVTFNDSVSMPTGQAPNTTKLLTITTVNNTPTSAPVDGTICYDSTNKLFYIRRNGVWDSIFTSNGPPTLANVLLSGATTGSTNISIDSGQAISFAGGDLTISNTTNSKPIKIGYSNTASGNNSFCIGNNNNAAAYTGCVLIGQGLTATANGHVMIGGATNPVQTSTTATNAVNAAPTKIDTYLPITVNGTNYKIGLYLP
jgi:hypothetical protein